MPNMGILLFILCGIAFSQSQNFNINLITANEGTMNIYNNGLFNQSFIEQTAPFNCSINTIFTYSQTPPQKISNAPYTIQFSNVPGSISLSITTQYGVINPTLSSNFCSSTTCNIYITNNCVQNTGQFNYFDIIQIQVSGLSAPIAYNVLCDNTFSTNTFQWGLIILMLFCLILIVSMVFFSKAWSIGGAGVKMNYWIVVVFWVVVIIGGVVAQTTTGAIQTIIQVVILIIGIAGVSICTSETVFLCKIKFLQHSIRIKDILRIRILDGISLLVGVGFAVGYYFSNKNWIVNDIICVSIIIATIKIMKFTNLKISLFTLIIGLVVQMTFVQIIHYTKFTSYNDLILNDYNYPFQIQLPTINAVYKQRCAWLPFTAIIYPGIFMSYLRRFDISRNTNIYFITAIVSFILGSIIWVLISLGSVHSWPYQLVTGPIMMILVVLFSYKRRQLRTLWQGSFYDQEFADREGINQLMEVINDQSSQRTPPGDSIQLVRHSVFSSLKINKREDSDLTLIKHISNVSKDQTYKQEKSISNSNKSQQS